MTGPQGVTPTKNPSPVAIGTPGQTIITHGAGGGGGAGGFAKNTGFAKSTVATGSSVPVTTTFTSSNHNAAAASANSNINGPAAFVFSPFDLYEVSMDTGEQIKIDFDFVNDEFIVHSHGCKTALSKTALTNSTKKSGEILRILVDFNKSKRDGIMTPAGRPIL